MCLQLDKLHVIKFGEVQLYRDNVLVEGGDPSFVQEAGGFTFFGAEALQAPVKCKYTVKVRLVGCGKQKRGGRGGHRKCCSDQRARPPSSLILLSSGQGRRALGIGLGCRAGGECFRALCSTHACMCASCVGSFLRGLQGSM